MAKKRINGEGTVWYVASEKRYRAQYPAGGKCRTTSGKTMCEVELKLRDDLAKRNMNTLEKSRKDSDTVGEFLLFLSERRNSRLAIQTNRESQPRYQ